MGWLDSLPGPDQLSVNESQGTVEAGYYISLLIQENTVNVSVFLCHEGSTVFGLGK